MLFDSGEPLAGGGYIVSHPEANYLVINGEGDKRAVVYHQYLHSLLRNNYPGLPLWLEEGLAEYYSTFRVGSAQAWIGTAISDHVQWLQHHTMIPLHELFAMDQSSKDYNEGKRRGVFYADRIDLAVNLTLAYAQAGDRAQAEELIEKVLVPSAPEMVEHARDAVLLGERQQVEKLIEEGKLAEAVPQLEALIARAPSGRRREELQRRLEEVHSLLDDKGRK